MKFVLKLKGRVSKCLDMKMLRRCIDGSPTGRLNPQKNRDAKNNKEKDMQIKGQKSRC